MVVNELQWIKKCKQHKQDQIMQNQVHVQCILRKLLWHTRMFKTWNKHILVWSAYYFFNIIYKLIASLSFKKGLSPIGNKILSGKVYFLFIMLQFVVAFPKVRFIIVLQVGNNCWEHYILSHFDNFRTIQMLNIEHLKLKHKCPVSKDRKCIK